jgi:flagellar protein FliT
MSTQPLFLACYEAIAHATEGMLLAARAADWDAFAEREHECATWIARAEDLGSADGVLDAQGRLRRLELMRRMLRDDAEIRDLMQPSLGRVDRCIGRAVPCSAEAR